MKNYSLNEEEAETFVLNYTVEDDKMIIHLASGKDYPMPYTPENEEKILYKMKKQVQNSSIFREKLEEKISSNDKWLFFHIVTLIPAIDMVVSRYVDSVFLLLNLLFFSFALGRGANIIDAKKIIEDIDKNKMFLEKEKLINEKVISNQRILCNLDAKIREYIVLAPEDRPLFTLNDMDKVNYKDVETMVILLSQEELFGPYVFDTQEEKPMKLTRTKE